MAPPLKTFLTDNPVRGKTVIVFETNMGSGMTDVESDVRNMCSQSIFKEGIALRGPTAKHEKIKIQNWLKRIDVVK